MTKRKDVVPMASPDDMFIRGTVWYAWIHYYDPQQKQRVSVPWSTGTKISGKKDSAVWNKAKEQAMIKAGQRTLDVITGAAMANLTIADAERANFDAKTNKKCAPATFEVLKEKWVHVKKHFGDSFPLSSIDDVAIKDFVTAMKQGKTSPDGVPQTAGSCARTLAELFFGIRSAGIALPKYKMSDLVGKRGKGTRNSLDRAGFAKLMAHTNPKWRDHLLMYRLTGVRKAELYLIEARHVSLSEGMLTVPGSDSANGDDGRTIPIHSQLVPMLQERMKRCPTGPLFELWNNADRDLKDAGVRACVGVVSFNVIKSSFGAEMLRAGVPTRAVAELYGHSSTRMVEEHYNQLKAGVHLKSALKKVKAVEIAPEGDET